MKDYDTVIVKCLEELDKDEDEVQYFVEDIERDDFWSIEAPHKNDSTTTTHHHEATTFVCGVNSILND